MIAPAEIDHKINLGDKHLSEIKRDDANTKDYSAKDSGYTLAFIKSLLVMLKTPQDNYAMIRAIYAPFGVSWLDGLDCFDTISANYCLIYKTSPLVPQVRKL